VNSSIGVLLRETRTKKAISLEEVHAKIKIHPRVLELLEENRFEKLPSPLFVKSFLKSYAEYLELSVDEVIQSYEKQERREPEQVLFIKPAEMREKAQRPTPKWVAGLGVGLTVVVAASLLIFGIVKIANRLSEIKWPTAPAAKARPRPAPKTASPAKTATARAQPAAKPAEAKKASAGWLRTPEMNNFPRIAKKTPLELQIKAIDAVWVHITCDGKVLFQGILKRGVAENWTANDSIEVWTGNPSNMYLTLNKSDLGSPGKGSVKRMKITRDGVRIV